MFPYVVGPSFKFKPNQFNLTISSNTVDYDIEANGWFRNTEEYHLNNDRSGYDYIFDSRSENEDLIEINQHLLVSRKRWYSHWWCQLQGW